MLIHHFRIDPFSCSTVASYGLQVYYMKLTKAASSSKSSVVVAKEVCDPESFFDFSFIAGVRSDIKADFGTLSSHNGISSCFSKLFFDLFRMCF